MHQDQAREIARAAAVACHERHDYMPPTLLLAETWQPHRWVVDAMLCAAEQMRAHAAQAVAAERAELEQLRAYADALNARCVADTADAERYRWIREGEWDCFDSRWLSEHDIYGAGPVELDALIDAAIRKDAA